MKAWLSPQEVGDLLGGVSAQKIRTEIAAGELPAVYLRFRSSKRGIFKIRAADADAYVDRMLAPAIAPTSPARVTGPTLVAHTTRTTAPHEQNERDTAQGTRGEG